MRPAIGNVFDGIARMMRNPHVGNWAACEFTTIDDAFCEKLKADPRQRQSYQELPWRGKLQHAMLQRPNTKSQSMQMTKIGTIVVA